MNPNVVIISAHPDDMEIGMDGTVANLVESKAVVTYVGSQLLTCRTTTCQDMKALLRLNCIRSQRS